MDDDARQLGQCLPADLLLRMERELMGDGVEGVPPRRPVTARREDERSGNVVWIDEWKRRHRVTTRGSSPRRR